MQLEINSISPVIEKFSIPEIFSKNEGEKNLFYFF